MEALERGANESPRAQGLAQLRKALDESPRVAAQGRIQEALDHSPSREALERSRPARAVPAAGAPVQGVWGAEALGALGSGLWSLGSTVASTAMANPYLSLLLAGGAGALALAAYMNRGAGALKGPREGQVGLEALPEEERWRLFINPKDFRKAAAAHGRGDISSPGDYYGAFDEEDVLRDESQRSDAFKTSMTEAMKAELLFSGGKLGRKVDSKEYARLHDLVTGKFRPGESSGGRESMRRPSGVETKTGFPINDWNDNPSRVAGDLQAETLGGLPLVYNWKESDGRIEPGQKGVTFFVDDEQNIRVNYTQAQGPKLVQSILDRYYKEVGAAKTKPGKLAAIVRAVRAIHVVHPFRDANGRLNVQILLNKLLLEQGFSPTILPEEQGLGAFGGVYSVDELSKMVTSGMGTFESLAGGGRPEERDKEAKKNL